MSDLVITIAGVVKPHRVRSIHIVESENGRSTLSFELESSNGAYRPAKRAEVIVTEGATRVFGGHIVTPSEAGLDNVGLAPIVTRVDAVDFNALAERRYVNVTIPAGTLKAALQVLATYLAPYGVTLDVAQVNGPDLPELTYEWTLLADVLADLRRLTGYSDEIDYHKVLRMFPPGTLVAPFNIIDGDRHVYGDLSVEPSDEDYANRVIVLAGSGTKDIEAERHYGDGATRVFPLNIPAVSLHPITWVTQGGVLTGHNVGVYGVDNLPWTFEAATNSLHQRNDQPVLTGADFLEQTYVGRYPIARQADNLGEQASAGLWERVFAYPDVFDATVAQALANAIVLETVVAPKVVRYATRDAGIRARQTQSITKTTRNVTGSHTIAEVHISEMRRGVVLREVVARQGSVLQSSWQDTYKQWGGGGTGATTVAGGATIISGGLAGSGTTGKIPKWLTSGSLGDSIMSEAGGVVTVTGGLVATTLAGALSASYLTGIIPAGVQDAITRVGTVVSGVWNAGAVTSSGGIAGTTGSFSSTLGVTGVSTFGASLLPAVNYGPDLGSLTAKFRLVHAAELWVQTLVAHESMATTGGRWVIPKATTSLVTDLAAADTSIHVKHNNLANGDRIWLEANGQLEFMAVTSSASGTTPPVFDAASTSSSGGAATLTWAHTCSGANRLLLVSVATASVAVSSVTFNGDALTLLDVESDAGGPTRVEIWYRIAPDAATGNIVVTLASSAAMRAGGTSFTNVHQVAPFGTVVHAFGNSNTASVVVPSAASELVYDAISVRTSLTTMNVGAGQTARHNGYSGSNLPIGAASTEPGAASTTMSWAVADATAKRWVQLGVSIKPAPATGPGDYVYTVTRNLDGTGANDWPAGSAVVNTGTIGDGFIDAYASNGVLSGVGPAIVGNVRTGLAHSDLSPRWAVGNLNGLYGYATTTYGAAFGDPAGAWLKIDPANGLRIGHNATTKVQIDGFGNAIFTGPSITLGTDTVSAFGSSAIKVARPHGGKGHGAPGDVWGMAHLSITGSEHRTLIENTVVGSPGSNANSGAAEIHLVATGWSGGGAGAAAPTAEIRIESSPFFSSGSVELVGDHISASSGIYERFRSTRMGEWEAIAPNLANYTVLAGAASALTQSRYSYSRVGTTVFVELAFTVTLSAATNEVRVTLPFTAAGVRGNPCLIHESGSWKTGTYFISSAINAVRFFKEDFGATNIAAGTFQVYVQFWYEV